MLNDDINPLLLRCMFIHIATRSALNCTRPNAESLHDALEETIFTKNHLRPVKQIETPTNIAVSFILVGILGVVSALYLTHFCSF